MQTTHPNPSLRLNIIGTGKGLPSRLVPSTEIDALLGIKEGHTEKLSGLAQRYFLADDESADAMRFKPQKMRWRRQASRLTMWTASSTLRASTVNAFPSTPRIHYGC